MTDSGITDEIPFLKNDVSIRKKQESTIEKNADTRKENVFLRNSVKNSDFPIRNFVTDEKEKSEKGSFSFMALLNLGRYAIKLFVPSIREGTIKAISKDIKPKIKA